MKGVPSARIGVLGIVGFVSVFMLGVTSWAQEDETPAPPPAEEDSQESETPGREDAETPEAPSSETAPDDSDDPPPSETEEPSNDTEGSQGEGTPPGVVPTPEPSTPDPSAVEDGESEGEGTGEAVSSAEEDDDGALASAKADEGRALYQSGHYVEALAAFQAAYNITPTAALAYNIARSHERLSQWSESVEWYKRYVELETDPRERADALDKIALLEDRAGGSSPDDQFEARMLSGRQAYARGNFEGAIEDFQAAFDARPEAAPLYNIAKSYEKMARYEDALDYFNQYLELDPNAPDRADVEATIARLKRDIRARFQELSVASSPPGADVYLDDRNEGIIGQTNLATKLRPGPHTIYIDLNGYEPVRRDFVMPTDKPLVLEFNLQELENVGYVTIDVAQPGARIFIDGAIVGLSPFTQEKALEAGEHQIQVELVGYERYAQSFLVERDVKKALSIDLVKYNPPISDGTLTDWGRNLLLFGAIGGALGFAAPIIYQEVVLGRAYFDELGPDNRAGRPFYDGSPASLRSNNERDTLETVQVVSLVVGGTLMAGGLAFYMYKWLRPKVPPPVTASNPPSIQFTGIGVMPVEGGGTVGLSGRF